MNFNVFIVGCPRSGKTLLQEMLAFHDDFAWFSQYYRKFRFFPEITVLNRVYDIPVIGNFLVARRNKKVLPRPIEMRKDYNPALRKIGTLDAKDVTEKDANDLRWIFQRQIRIQNKKRMITDYGRPARMLYFSEIFPGSKFIHVLRDGKNVAAAMLKERPQWFTESNNLYTFCRTVPKEFIEILSSFRGTPDYGMVLAALRWKVAIIEIEGQKRKMPGNSCMVVKYDDLIKDKFAVVDRCLDFLELNWTKRLKLAVKSKQLYPDDQWCSFFDSRQRDIIDAVLNVPIPEKD